jgi:hypothetical protein
VIVSYATRSRLKQPARTHTRLPTAPRGTQGLALMRLRPESAGPLAGFAGVSTRSPNDESGLVESGSSLMKTAGDVAGTLSV